LKRLSITSRKRCSTSKTTLLVLRMAEMDSQPDTEDLVYRVFAALAMTEAACVDARRRRIEKAEAPGE
jgi:hypothetical protein